MPAITNEGRDGYGIKVTIKEVGSATAAAEVKLLLNIDDAGLSVGKMNWSHSQSPNRTKQYKAGWADPGEYSFENQWTAAAYALVTAAAISGKMQTVEVTLPLGPNGEQGFKDVMTGFVVNTSKKVDGVSEDPVGFSWAVQVSGTITTTVIDA